MVRRRYFAALLPCVFVFVAHAVGAALNGTRAGPVIASPFVVGGSYVNGSPYPWFAFFLGQLAGGNGALQCGAFLVAPTRALTAAHCMTAADGSPVVFINLYFQSTGNGEMVLSQHHTAVQYTVHPLYEGAAGALPFAYDVAVVDLASPVPGITPPSLVLDPAAPLPAGFSVVGFGADAPGGGIVSNLKHAALERVTTPECNAIWGAYQVGADICARTYEAGCTSGCDDICSGDSGGPLFTESPPTVWGVVSRGSSMCGSGYPAMFARASAYEAFLDQVIFGAVDPNWPPPQPTPTSGGGRMMVFAAGAHVMLWSFLI